MKKEGETVGGGGNGYGSVFIPAGASSADYSLTVPLDNSAQWRVDYSCWGCSPYIEQGYYASGAPNTTTWDWNQASVLGMESINLTYSGYYGFIETEMYWPINHMVTPAEDALKCSACHSEKGNGRLDWEALGYPGDPMKTGGRSKK